MSKYSKKSNIRKRKYVRKSKKSKRSTRPKKSRKSRKILRLVRNKSGGGGQGFAPWIGSRMESLNHNSPKFRHIEHQYDRTPDCLLMSCHQK